MESILHICEQCGNSFAPQWGKPNRYCSALCYRAARKDNHAAITSGLMRVCEVCGVDFTTRPEHTGRFCSRRCMSVGRRKSVADRFWSKVDKSDTCWIWRGATANKGYGSFRHKDKSRGAHAVAYELTYGPIPKGMCVMHSCDNPPCVNPAHLSLGTKADNTADMMKKGRHVTQKRAMSE
jgi:hypothetical protein